MFEIKHDLSLKNKNIFNVIYSKRVKNDKIIRRGKYINKVNILVIFDSIRRDNNNNYLNTIA